VLQTILFDPQTSGGLLFAIDSDDAAGFQTAFAGANVPLWRIGEVVAGAGIDVGS
jgi:selenide,water dikinase